MKLLDPSDFDYLFVLVGDGRRWFIPADARRRRYAASRLGGPKYAEFEVEPRRSDSGLHGRIARLYNRLLTVSGGCPSG